MMATKQIRVGIYSRVSTEEQAATGISLVQQPEIVEKKLVDLYGATGYEIVLAEQDAGLSGSFGPSANDFERPTKSKKDRPGLRRILRAIGNHEIDVLAVYDLSRLYRKADSLLALFHFVRTNDVKLRSVAEDIELDSAAGELAANVLAVIGQFQRRQNNERIKHNLDLRREKGMWQGTAPYGWRFPTEAEREDGRPRTLTPVLDELAVVRRIGDLFLQGMREKRIADQLNAEGIKHRLKKKDSSGKHLELDWDWQSISNILKCCAHAGLVRQPDDSHGKGLHYEGRAYDPTVFHRIKESMGARRKQLRGVPKDRGDNLLSKLVTCGHCPQGLQFVKGQSSETDVYLCRGHRGRGDYHVYVPADLLLRAVLHEMEQFSTLPELRKQGEAQIKKMLASEMQDAPDRIRELSQHKAKLTKQMDQALDHLRENILDRQLFVRQKDSINSELLPIEAELATLSSKRDGARFFEARLQRALKALGQFGETWQGLHPAEQRELLRLSIETASVRDLQTHNELRLKLGPFDEVVINLPKHQAARGKAATGIKGLTLRELAALSYVLDGVKPVDAAARMGVSAGTYSTLCKRAMKRVGVWSVKDAAKKATPWIRLVEHLLPKGPWNPHRRLSRNEVTIAERIATELHADGQPKAEIANAMGLEEEDISAMLNDAQKKERKLGA